MLADAVVAVHALFVTFVAVGGLLALRWPKIAYAHIPAALWGAFIELTGRICPLTPLEIRLREQAGQAGYQGDFIAHYILPVIYPEGLTRHTQLALGGLVIVTNVAIYIAVWRRTRNTNEEPGIGTPNDSVSS
jgi:hypothetical protein